MKEILEKTSSDSCGCGHDHHDVHDHAEHAHEEHHHHEHDDEHCGCGCEDHEHHHDHDDHCACGCEDHEHGHEHHHHHDHDDHCACGCEDHEHEHHHHHNHDDEHCACSCEDHEHGHEHHHHHDHDDHCACGCEDHEHEHGHHHPHSTASAKRVYILENLGCAHCASKMEEQIQHLDGVENATITFATKQLRLNAADPDALLPQIRKICTSIESEVIVVPRNPKPSASADVTTRIYLLENLGCAHCASKMEEQIADLDGISEATITFATRQLRVTAKNPDRYLDQIRRICTSIESEVIVKEKDPKPKAQVATSETHAASTKRTFSKEKIDTICIIIGAILFVAGEIMEHKGFSDTATLPVFVIAYLALGGVIVVKAAKNISHGQIFDENFLMSIATLAAFAINDSAEAVGVMLFYRIGELFEEKAVERSRGQIMDAVDLRPEVVNLVAGDDVQVIPSENAQVGDVLLVRPGDRIPLDGVIIEGSSRIDTSPITGEPVPVAVNEGDEITSGCVNTSGQLKIRVEKPLGESMVTRILDSVENAAASKPKIDRFITRFAKVYTPCVVGIAVATALIPSLATGNWHYWIYTAITFLVMSCPCALVLSIPLAFFSGIGAGSKKGILFKGGLSIEGLSHLGAVVMDKTGTVTEGNFQLQKVVTTGEYNEKQLLAMCAGCEQNSTHPIANSIVAAAKERGISLEKPLSLEEISGHGISAQMPEGKVLCGNRKLMDKFGVTIGKLHEAAYGSEVFMAVNGKFAGYMLISDTIKPDAKNAIASLKKLGLHTVMLTGDSEDSAQAVGKEVGIDEIYAKLLPEDKLNALKKIRQEHGTVMFVGDGINDAPVLAGADVGAAMGSGADAAIEAADAVFMNSNVDAIPQSVSIAKNTNRIAWQNVIFALVIKIAVMILGLAGHANMWMAVFADTGVAMICVLNSIRILYKK
ncbi:cadmium-translocating P-type ATPase [Blautia luti]|uniref:heavy metal translocating P-type ATPase n=1 Tax=Blautia luti TaxID=89014 RepID=UPI001D0085F9|nr:heavy metal translocating P-type ATPase [Blautia luti]MCB5473461.1 cadmium-translocating P-type ATPase [Blautia luti]